MNYKSDLVYPEIKVKENIKDAKKLLDIFTSQNSIINNILMHIYESSIIDDEISNIIKNIINVELNHAKIMSKLINNLGLKPKYIYKNMDNYRYYNTSYIYYNVDILNTNIKLKKELIEKYNILIKEIEDNNIKEILKRLVIDEEIHLKIFEGLLTTHQNSV